MANDDQVRIVITGHTGLEKKQCIARLCAFIYSQDRDWCEASHLSNPQARERRENELAQAFDVEEKLVPAFLLQSERDQRELWKDSFLTAINKWENEDIKPRFAFLSLHVTFQVYSHFTSPLAWNYSDNAGRETTNVLIETLSNKFRPHYFINLIDDVHLVQKRIRKHGYEFRLLELLRWRNVEMLMTDILSQLTIPTEYRDENPKLYPFERSPIVAVRHPRQMLYSLFAKPNQPRVYASYPISEPRRIAKRTGNRNAINEINRFRSQMHDEFTVFDPVTEVVPENRTGC